jgi:phosphoribosyl-AMP cyclohydrolase
LWGIVGKTSSVGLALEDLGDSLVEQVVAACRRREPSTLAILVHGSYATGAAHPQSDLDLDLVVGDPRVHYRTWFEDRSGQPPLHVSARCDLTPKAWAEETDEPEDWSLGLPVRLVYRWLWKGDADVAASIGHEPVLNKPGGPPEIEDMVDAVLKLRRYASGKDDIGVRLQAREAARFAAPTLAALNDPTPVADPRSAVEGILALPVAPPGWRSDFLTAFGLARAPLDQVIDAADRLVLGTLRLSREINPGVDDQPDIERYLSDGTLERLLQ